MHVDPEGLNYVDDEGATRPLNRSERRRLRFGRAPREPRNVERQNRSDARPASAHRARRIRLARAAGRRQRAEA